MKNKFHLLIGAAVLILALCLSISAQTMPKKSSSPFPNTTNSPAKQVARPIPFHGMISAVDQKEKTFTISGKEKSRIFKVTNKTTITRARNTATIKDIAENEEVSGSAWQNPDGTLEAKMVKLGPMEKAKTSAATPSTSPKGSPSPKP